MATDRLRRQLRDKHDNDVAQLTQNFCFLGTPLPALESTKKDVNELKPIWQQEARDEQGRRRFHGAFTGGFSAGYFNTVGSAEGWTPSSFRSSRADKSKGAQSQARPSRPEDFMDEEDLEDRRGARQIRTSSIFTSESGAEDRDPFLQGLSPKEPSNHDLLASALLRQIRPKTSSAIGFEILRSMGWKDGQGLGPRVDAVRRDRLLRLTSNQISSISRDREAPSEEEKKHLFAPPRMAMHRLEDNGQRHGLGWVKTSDLNELLSSARTKNVEYRPSRNNLDIGEHLPRDRSSTMGDSDDEDIFSDEIALQSTLAQNRRRRQDGPPATQATPTSSIAHVSQNWPGSVSVLSGFCPSPDPPSEALIFQPDQIPEGWSPDPSRVWKQNREADTTVGASGSTGERSRLAQTACGNLLGETKIPGPPPNISAFLSAKAQERLAAMSGAQLPSGLNDPDRLVESVAVPRTDSATARQALRGFMPFGMDVAKQDRYRQYLESQLDPASEGARQQRVPSGITADHFTQELREFAKSAAIFRPMSSSMANRFTTASASSSAQEFASPSPGLWQPPPQHSDQDRTGPTHPNISETEKPLSAAQKAAKMGNFGAMTRKVEPWIPARLLSKRFGLPAPHADKSREHSQTNGSGFVPEGDDPFYGSTASTRKKHSHVKVDQHWEREKANLKALAAGPSPLTSTVGTQNASSEVLEAASSEKANPFAELDDDEAEAETHDTELHIQPSIDIFKSVFGSDGEGSDEEEFNTIAARPKMQDPTSGAALTFQARSKRKEQEGGDLDADAQDKNASLSDRKKKKKKEKKTKSTKGMLTFDLDELPEEEAPAPDSQASHQRATGKGRIKAADLF